MNKVFFQEMKNNLLSQKKSIISKSTRNLEIDTDGDEIDEIQANVLLELANQLEGRDLVRLQQIDEALRKIENNSYGICQDCDEEIPEKRLLMNPYFTTCVLCSEAREIEQKQKGRV